MTETLTPISMDRPWERRHPKQSEPGDTALLRELRAEVADLRMQVATIPALTRRIALLEQMTRAQYIDVVTEDDGRYTVLVNGESRATFSRGELAQMLVADWMRRPAEAWITALGADL